MKVGRDNQDRVQILDLSERLVPDLATPPRGGPGVCARCSTWTRAVEPADVERALAPNLCENCLEVRSTIDREPLALSVISLYRKPSPLRDILTRYKGRDDEDPFDPACVQVVRGMLGRYLLEHGDSLLRISGGIDGIVVVPSTDGTHPHPLEKLVDSLGLDLPCWPMLARGTGELGFRKPSRDGYRVVMAQAPSRIFLLDDVYTTGSRLNSAASALDKHGHEVVAALVLARRINTNYAPEALQLWDAATAEPFDWQTSPKTVRA